jgi:hypothetical protein
MSGAEMAGAEMTGAELAGAEMADSDEVPAGFIISPPPAEEASKDQQDSGVSCEQGF